MTDTPYEAKAREIAQAFINANWIEGGIIQTSGHKKLFKPTQQLVHDIAQALSAAHLSGYEKGKEEAAQFHDYMVKRLSEPGKKHLEQYRENLRASHQDSADAIRSLPGKG